MAGHASSAWADQGESARDLLPAETAMMITMDIERLRGTIFFQEYKKMIAASPQGMSDYEAFKKNSGIDPEKNVKSIVIAVPTSALKDFPGSIQHWTVISRGAFDRKKLVDWTVAEGMLAAAPKKEVVGSAEIYHTSEAELAFKDDLVAIEISNGGSPRLTRVRGEGKALQQGALAAQLKRMTPAKDIWIVAAPPQHVTDELEGLKTLNASVDFTNGLSVHAALEMETPQQAQALVEQLRAIVGAVSQQPALKPLASKLQFTAKDRSITLSLEATAAEFQTILGLLIR